MRQIGHILYKKYLYLYVYLSNLTFFYHDEQIIVLNLVFLVPFTS